jgi:nucleoside 2-deoxyribosyltransferase
LKTIYLAGALFSEAEQSWLRDLKEKLLNLNTSYHVVWPFELISEDEIKKLGATANTHIFEVCRTHLETTQILVAILDGAMVDDGTAWEVGYYYAKKSKTDKIIGVRTDFRRAGETDASTVNAMIECACDQIVYSSNALIEFLDSLQGKGLCNK